MVASCLVLACYTAHTGGGNKERRTRRALRILAESAAATKRIMIFK